MEQTVDNSECSLMNADGKLITILKKAVSMKMSGREYIIESFVDITERKEC